MHSTSFAPSKGRLRMPVKQLNTSTDVIDLCSQKSVPHFQSGIHILNCVLLCNKRIIIAKKLNKQFPAGSNMEICHDDTETNMTSQEYRTSIHSSVTETTAQDEQHFESGMYTNCMGDFKKS